MLRRTSVGGRRGHPSVLHPARGKGLECHAWPYSSYFSPGGCDRARSVQRGQRLCGESAPYEVVGGVFSKRTRHKTLLSLLLWSGSICSKIRPRLLRSTVLPPWTIKLVQDDAVPVGFQQTSKYMGKRRRQGALHGRDKRRLSRRSVRGGDVEHKIKTSCPRGAQWRILSIGSAYIHDACIYSER